MKLKIERGLLALFVLTAGAFLIPYMSLSGYTVNWQTAAGAYEPDSDLDGVSDEVENEAPNGGDGNDDGTQDSLQGDVASLPDPESGDYITLVADEGVLADVAIVSPEEIGSAPPGGPILPFGLVQFRLVDIEAGDTYAVYILFETPVEIDGWWKYGPASAGAEDSWFDFEEGAPGLHVSVGASFDPGFVSEVTLWLTDGLKGDADFSANGVIVDPSGGAQGGMAVELQGAQIFRVGRNVHLKWRTASEIKHAGFHVYRVDAEGNEQRVNRRLITPKGGELSGGDYHQIDWLAPTGPLEYWIEDLDTLGNAKRHGPYKVGSPAPQQPVEPDSAP